MAFEWFRSWHGAPTDAKYRVIARRAGVAPGMVSAVYWALLDYASQNKPRGSVEGFDTETYAEWAGWEESDVQAIIAAFVVKETIIDDKITSWDKRQPKREDDSAGRVKAFRDRQRVTSGDVTQSNAMKRNVNDRSESDQIRPDQKDEGLRTPPPIDPFPEQSPEYREALRKLDGNWPGMVTGTTQIKLTKIWGRIVNGKAAWLDDAILEAKAREANTPDYAVKILENAIRDNKRPGQTPEPKRNQGGRTRSLDEILGITPNGK